MASSKKKGKAKSKPDRAKLRRAKPGESSGVPEEPMFGGDSTSVTSLRDPAPLPPSPADSSDPGGWLDQMPTNPAKIPDLGALAGGGTDPGSLQAWGRQSIVAKGDADASERRRDAAHVVVRPSVSILLLVAAACLAIGMVVGAILQSRLGTPPYRQAPPVEAPQK